MAKRAGQEAEGSPPDYLMWVRMTLWKRPEAIALALGLDPDRNLLDESGNGTIPAALEKTRRVLQRAFEGGAFPSPIQIAPSEFLSWLKSNRIEAPKPLLDAAAKQGGDVKDWRAECERLKVQLHAAQANSTKSKDRTTPVPSAKTLYTIILGIAHGRYGFNPTAARNRATAELKREIENVGLTIDEESILNALRTTAEELDFQARQTDR